MTESYSSNLRSKLAEPDLAVELQKLGDAMDSGNLRQAHKLKTKFLKNPAGSFTGELQSRFAKLDTQLGELDEKQSELTKPQRIELCEKMETLARQTEFHPEHKAVVIKEIQHAWRTLGASKSEEGHRLWLRFKKAGEQAFLVCQDHFDNNKIQRDLNLQKKISIIEELITYYSNADWLSPNWKMVGQTLKNAKNQWKSCSDIPHAHRKEIHLQFSKALDPIQSLLEQEQEKNHLLKQGYIEQLDDLLLADMKTASLIKEIKTVQTLWKKTGVTARGKDQRLWVEFRKRCDEAFLKRDKIKEDAEPPAKDSTKCGGNNLIPHDENILSETRRQAALCQQIENGADPETIKEYWKSTIKLPDSVNKLIDLRHQQAVNGLTHYADVNVLNELCVHMEILAKTNSPSHSKDLRLKLQVERLNLKLSKGIKDFENPLQHLTKLQINWYSQGAIPENEIDLEGRFLVSDSTIRE
jgi:hypothetical protein